MPSQRGSPKVVSQDSLDVLQRGQPAQLHWKDFFTLPYAKKNGWFWEAKQLLSWFLFQPASHLGLPEGVSYISQWNPTEKGLDTFEQSRHAVDKILHQLPWKEISHDSQCFHQWLTEFSPINHSLHLMPSVSCFPFPQTTGKPDIEQAGVQLELAQAMEARNSAIFGEELRVDCPSVSMFVVWGIHVFLGHFWVIERNPGFFGQPGFSESGIRFWSFKG